MLLFLGSAPNTSSPFQQPAGDTLCRSEEGTPQLPDLASGRSLTPPHPLLSEGVPVPGVGPPEKKPSVRTSGAAEAAAWWPSGRTAGSHGEEGTL